MRGAAAIVVLLAAASCAAPPAPPPGASAPAAPVEPVVLDRPAPAAPGGLGLAAIFPTVGRFSLSGIQSLNGARLAVEDVNRAGGIHGRPLVLLPYRTGSYFVDAGRAARLAESEGRALAIVGSNASSLSEAIAEVAEGQGIPQVSNVSTADDLTWDPVTGEDRPFVFRVCGSDAHMGAHLAEFAEDHLRARRVAMLYEVGRTYSAKLARSFADRFSDPARGRVVAEFFYLPLETEFRTQLREVAAFRPDVVFVPGSFTDATLIAMQAEQIGLQATLLGADAWSNRLLFKRGGPARPAFHSDHCDPPPDFLERYQAAFGAASEGCRAVLSYDAVEAIARALQALGHLDDAALGPRLADTRVRVKNALSAVRFTGQAGHVRFDEHGDVVRGVPVFRVSPGGEGYESRLVTWLGMH